MATLLPLVRALGKLRQLTAADTLRLPGPLNHAVPVDYGTAGALTAGVFNWDLIASNTAVAPGTATTIASMTGATDGAVRMIKFGAGHTLVNGVGVLELPGNASITTEASDTAIFLRRSSTRWQCAIYHRHSGLPLHGLNDTTKLPLTGGTLTGALSYAAVISLAAASTVDLASANGNYVSITGAGATISSLGSGTDGQRRLVRFVGVNTLVHGTSSIILPGDANIVTAADDLAEFYCRGSGAGWRCLYYTRKNGVPLAGAPDATKLPLAGGTMTGAINFAGYVAITAAQSMNIEGAASNTVRVDYSGGALNITVFGSGTFGTRRILYFNNSTPFTLVHSGGNMILPGNANIVPAQGDFAEFQCDGGGTWRCMWYQRRSGLPLVSAGGSMTTYTWDQASALAVWTIPHNLGRFPSVTVVDGLGVKVEPDVTYTDANTVTVTHSAALAGKAYLN